MPAPSFTSFPTLFQPTSSPAREESPPKRQKRSHHTEDVDERNEAARFASRSHGRHAGASHIDPRESKHRVQDRSGRRDGERDSRRDEERDRDEDRRRRKDRDRDRVKKETNDRDRDSESRSHRARPHEMDRDDGRKAERERRHKKKARTSKPSSPDREARHYSSQRTAQSGSTTTYALPVRDEEAGFFADTIGTGRGMVQADWKGVPRYRRETQIVLGLSDNVCIDKYKDDSQPGISLRWKGQVDKASQRTHLPQAAPDDQIRRLTVSDEPFESTASFLPLSRIGGIMSDDEDQTFKDEFDAEFSSFPFAERLRQDEVKALEQAVNTDPHDVQSWLRYSTIHIGRQRHTASTAAVSLAVLDKALANSGNETSAALHLAYIGTAGEIWTGDQLVARWAEVMRLFPIVRNGALVEGSVEVWLEYLGWSEGPGLAVVERNEKRGFDAVVEIYHGVVREVRAVLLHGADEETEKVLLYMYLRYALFVRQSGYHELGYALMQSLMEITFFRPRHLRGEVPFGQLLGEFAVFWDSDALRFGEDGASGWCNATSVVPSTNTDIHTIPDIGQWHAAEVAADRSQNRASRLGIDIETDPFRCVVFEDLLPVLFPITSPDIRTQAISAFLAFVSITVSPPKASTASSADLYMHWKLGASPALRTRMWPEHVTGLALPWRDTGRTSTPAFGCPVKSWISQPRTMISSGDWFQDISTDDLADLDVSFIRNAIELLRPLVEDPTLAVLCLAVEAATSVKGALNLSKRLLKAESENLILWDAHARLERLRGRMDAARTIYATALAAAVQRDQQASEDEVRVWQALLEMEIAVANDKVEEVLMLFALRDGDRIVQYGRQDTLHFTHFDRLKTKKFYHSMTTSSAAARYLKASYIARIEAAPESACDYLEQSLSGSSTDAATEAIRQSYAHFLATLPVPPFARFVRHVTQSVALFPNNTIFLSLLIHLKRQGRDVLDIMSKLDQAGDKTLVNGLWASWAIAAIGGDAFWKHGSSERERVRLLLDRLVTDEKTNRSPSAWVVYIEFEAEFAPSKAKALCYRALNHVGANKDLFMLPYSSRLLHQFSARELNDWTQVMLDRGIRMRVPVPAAEVVYDVESDLSEGGEAGDED